MTKQRVGGRWKVRISWFDVFDCSRVLGYLMYVKDVPNIYIYIYICEGYT